MAAFKYVLGDQSITEKEIDLSFFFKDRDSFDETVSRLRAVAKTRPLYEKVLFIDKETKNGTFINVRIDMKEAKTGSPQPFLAPMLQYSDAVLRLDNETYIKPFNRKGKELSYHAVKNMAPAHLENILIAKVGDNWSFTIE